MQSELPSHRMQVTDNLDKLLTIFPDTIRSNLEKHFKPDTDNLIEVVLDLGRLPEARFSDRVEYIRDQPVTQAEIQHCIEGVGMFSSDNRAGIERTLHRISAIRNRTGDIIGLTCRIGRAIFGTIVMIRDLVETGQSILLLGRPGVGKTTALREIARVLADDLGKRVVIIDTSNEIAGDGDIPHPAIGRARRMQVARPELQHQVMIEAVENHMPEVIVIDEIGTELEALAARTIAERGVQLVGTAHGNSVANLIKNPTLSDLIGGIQSVTLGDDEARRRRTQKTVLERKAPPTFAIAVEMLERQRWVVHDDVATTIDTLLRGMEAPSQIRTVDDQGEVTIVEPELPLIQPLTSSRTTAISPLYSQGLRSSGKMTPVALNTNISKTSNFDLDGMLEHSWQTQDPYSQKIRTPGPNGEDLPVYIYAYGIGRSQIEQVIEILNLPIVFTKDVMEADAVIALRSQIKHHSKLRTLAQERHIPIYTVKSNTIPQITRIFRQILNLDDPNIPEPTDLRLFSKAGSDDELEALEEARLAVEQIVIPKGQPVELLPRSAKVRKMQHELIEHYRLQSDSFGDEPNRRLRIYPA
ncbi:single-stranded nucleic acid binding R3H domain protein [Chondrocystis sp. NIES-4102]|nr:single-stranded nucleic acid binding R3H domain protein [Chondrocystis sp. NIES-4102]